MRQVARRLKDGRLELVEVPEPRSASRRGLRRLEASVLSAGTERATLGGRPQGPDQQSRARPDQARQVLEPGAAGRRRTDRCARAAQAGGARTAWL